MKQRGGKGGRMGTIPRPTKGTHRGRRITTKKQDISHVATVAVTAATWLDSRVL
jgi:hypothetical protein